MFALWSKRGAQLPETIVQTAWGTDIVMELQEQLGLAHFTLVTHQQGSGFAGHNSTLKPTSLSPQRSTGGAQR